MTRAGRLCTLPRTLFLSPFWLFGIPLMSRSLAVLLLSLAWSGCNLNAPPPPPKPVSQGPALDPNLMPFELNELKVGISTLQSFGANLALEPAGEPPAPGIVKQRVGEADRGKFAVEEVAPESVELQVIDGILYGIEMTVAADKAGAFKGALEKKLGAPKESTAQGTVWDDGLCREELSADGTKFKAVHKDRANLVENRLKTATPAAPETK